MILQFRNGYITGRNMGLEILAVAKDVFGKNGYNTRSVMEAKPLSFNIIHQVDAILSIK